jgi:D-amino peptidase
MRVFMMTDLEGPSGVNGRPAAGVGNQIINPETAQKALTNEVNACIEGLVAAGADSVTVVDGHGGSNSIDIFALHPAAELVQYGGSFACAFPEGKYDAAVQIGAHAMQHSGGYLCHTFNSHGNSGMRMNGTPIGEIGIETYVCAYFGIPMVLVSGDECACAEARELIGNEVETVATKLAYSRYSVRNYSPEKVYAELREKSRRALERRNEIPVVKIPQEIVLEYELMCPNSADTLEGYGAERVSFNTVRYRGNDFMRLWLGRFMPQTSVEERFGKILTNKA